VKVTSLEPQKKRKNRLNLYVNDEFRAGIDAGTAASLGLFIGKEIDEGTLSDLTDEESYQLCLDKAFLLLSIRMQTEHELWEKLGKKSLRKDIGRTIARLKELGYVDDAKFAKLWIESRSQGHGANSLRMDLIKKGLKREIIDMAIAELNPDQQVTAARELVKVKDKPEYSQVERFQKLGCLLSRRGFNYDIIKKALEKEE
jgi:regulatory protein